VTTVLITGGCGFAGSHLVEHLLATTGWRLVVLDGLTYAGRVDRLTSAAGFDPDRARVVWHDLRSPLAGPVDDQIGAVDAVLHLAAQTHVDRAIAHPTGFVLNNVASTLNLLQWARTRPELTHFVQVSTDEVYGPAAPRQAHREWDPHLPSNPYSASKSACEALTVAWWRTYGIPVVITNTMNLFGERQHPEKFVPMVIARLLAGQQIPLHARQKRARAMNAGFEWESSSRHWLHARNHADALRWILDTTNPPRYGDAERPDRWHVAGEELDVLTLAEMIAGTLGVAPDFRMVDYHSSRPGHDHRYALDAGKIAAAGWKPPVPLSTSLARTVLWYRENPAWLKP
jgi:dTDP-glucose 4,6-dehydratase